MKDSAGVTPLTEAEQWKMFAEITRRTRAKKEAELLPHIKDIRFDGSRDAFLIIDLCYSLNKGRQNMVQERLFCEHEDYVQNACWNKLGDQLIVILKSSPRHDPNRRRRARGDLPKIVSEMIAALQ